VIPAMLGAVAASVSMPTATFFAAGPRTAFTDFTTGITAQYPAGVQDGDALFLCFMSYGAPFSAKTISGWDFISNTSGLTLLGKGRSGDNSVFVQTANYGAAIVFVYRNCSGMPNAVSVTAVFGSLNVSAITSVADNNLALNLLYGNRTRPSGTPVPPIISEESGFVVRITDAWFDPVYGYDHAVELSDKPLSNGQSTSGSGNISVGSNAANLYALAGTIGWPGPYLGSGKK